MPDIMDVLKELDKEYGISNIPDGAYQVALGENTKEYPGKDGGQANFRFGWKVINGEYTGRELGDFLRWHPDTDGLDREAATKRVKASRGSVTSMFNMAAASLPEEVQPQLANAIVGIRDSESADEANAQFAVVAELARPYVFTVRAVTNQSGYQNVRYMEKGHTIEAPITDEQLAAVAV